VTVPEILLPVFVQVALIFALLFLMAGRRFTAFRAGAVRREDVILGQRAWPGQTQAAANAFSNQFELPVLFFAIVPLALITRKADLLFVVLSWLFVISRLVHAAAYVTKNVFPLRFGSYVFGAAILMIMWIIFAIRILAGPWPA
jgi:hypothetical protein